MKDFFIAFLAIIFLLVFTTVFTYVYFAKELKSQETIMNYKDTGVILQDQNGVTFFTFFDAKHKEPVPLSYIPDHVENAIISVEDRDFYTHPGFSVKSIIRSLILDIKSRNLAYGGSTITQQLVKNSILTPRKDFLRKYQEIVLASEIERRFNKNQILYMYINSAYFGEGAFGIEEAADKYFGKSVKDLSIAEGAMLAGLLPAPSRYSPLNGNILEAKKRQVYVLNSMFEEGYITKEQKEQAEKEELRFNRGDGSVNITAPHFALYVRDELVNKFGEEEVARSGLRVRTSLNLEYQKYAEDVVKDQVDKLAINRATNGAAVVIDIKTGGVLAMVGSKDWYDDKFGKVNMAVSPRQPGSSFKPIVYVAALEQGIITPATLLRDEPTTFETNYKPKDYDGKYRGQVTARRALANSLNIPSVQVLSMIGVSSGLDMASRLGITTLVEESRYGLSLALGAAEVKLLELTIVYATFANQGVMNSPTSILKVEDKYGNRIYEYKAGGYKVLEPEYTFLISSILSDNKSRAEVFGNSLDISRSAAVKTGTTEDYRDAWTIGYTPSLAIGVWVGNNDDTPMDNVAGSLGAAPVWKSLMEKFLENTPVENFQEPSGIVSATICGRGTSLASTSAYLEYFVQGTQPSSFCALSSSPISISPTISNVY